MAAAPIHEPIGPCPGPTQSSVNQLPNRVGLRALLSLVIFAAGALAGCGGVSTDGSAEESVGTTLSVNRVNASGGAVSSEPAGIDCNADCAETYPEGTLVTLHAQPLAGYDFTGWNGVSGCAAAADCVVTLQGPGLTATATFSLHAQPQYQLQVTVAASGSGTVSATPGAITSCTSTCVANFDVGTAVTLTATPASGFAFSAWSTGDGSCTGSSPVCQVALGAARTVTATFTAVPPVKRRLTVSPPSHGTIGSTSPLPPGIACGSDCTEDYVQGTTVSLQAAPASGYAFSSWGGDCASAGAASVCTLAMTADHSVSANFAALPPSQVALTVATVGTGAGKVTSAPVGIDCGATCNANFNKDRTVTLTAAPSAGSTFTSWSGACSGTTPTCTVTLAAATNVSAVFTRIRYTLSTSKAGSGTLSSTPAGIDCGTACSASFVEGQQVTLTATPAAGYSFTAWGGACSGSGACVVTMSAAKTVSATFTILQYGVQLSWLASTNPAVVGYRLYHGIASGNYDAAPTSVSTPQIDYGPVNSASTHYFAVSVVDSSGAESPLSAEIVVNVP